MFLPQQYTYITAAILHVNMNPLEHTCTLYSSTRTHMHMHMPHLHPVCTSMHTHAVACFVPLPPVETALLVHVSVDRFSPLEGDAGIHWHSTLDTEFLKASADWLYCYTHH